MSDRTKNTHLALAARYFAIAWTAAVGGMSFTTAEKYCRTLSDDQLGEIWWVLADFAWKNQVEQLREKAP